MEKKLGKLLLAVAFVAVAGIVVVGCDKPAKTEAPATTEVAAPVEAEKPAEEVAAPAHEEAAPAHTAEPVAAPAKH